MNTIELSGITGIVVKIECVKRRGPFLVQAQGKRAADAVRETHVRVRSALKACGVNPSGTWLINANRLDPAFDLALALAVAGHGAPDGALAFGELALDGRLRSTRGAFVRAEAAVSAGAPYVLVGRNDASRAAAVGGDVEVRIVEHLGHALAMARGEALSVVAPPRSVEVSVDQGVDFSDVVATPSTRHAVAALQVAAATGASVLIVGPPGVGKTMLSRRASGLLPPLTDEEAKEILRIQDIMGLAQEPRVKRPYRVPHYTCSPAAFAGGGSPARPGEVTLVHNGVLFLDDVAEFRKSALAVLRESIKSKSSTITCAHEQITFPARFLLIGTANPYQCGYFGSERQVCCCTEAQRCVYRRRRAHMPFDIEIRCAPSNFDSACRLPSTETLREQVAVFCLNHEGESGSERLEAARKFFGLESLGKRGDSFGGNDA